MRPACLTAALAMALSAMGVCACESKAQISAPAEVSSPQVQAPQLAAAHSEPLDDALAVDAQNEQEQLFFAPITEEAPLSCLGTLTQGGALLCKTYGSAKVVLGGIDVQADARGHVILGFDRDAALTQSAKIVDPGGHSYTQTFTLAKRDYDTSRIDGLPSNQVSTFTDDELAQIRSATARKKVGFASRVSQVRLTDGFIMPVKGRKTTNFGAQRILNGEPKSPHFGVDIAAPKGTPIVAPAAGVVSLADQDMYFEGALLMIDHGQGLISYYLHMDDILVKAGDVVSQGQTIATVGSKGRSTGPHLCWRLKWRGQNLDPELVTTWEKAQAQSAP